MKKAIKDGNTGIRWKMSSFLEDLDFADDLALISSKRVHIQTKVNNSGQYGTMTSLTISTVKTKLMRWNSPTIEMVQVDGKELEEVLKFVSLGEH